MFQPLLHWVLPDGIGVKGSIGAQRLTARRPKTESVGPASGHASTASAPRWKIVRAGGPAGKPRQRAAGGIIATLQV